MTDPKAYILTDILSLISCIAFTISIILLIFLCRINKENNPNPEIEQEEIVEVIEKKIEKEDFLPQPLEPKKVKIQEPEPEPVPTYPSYEEVVLFRILTNEARHDYYLCCLVAQALYNTCEKYHWQCSPLEMAYKYQYAQPLNWYSNEAQKAYEAVFLNGVRFPEIGNATLFYAPGYCTSRWHESQIFVYEANGVRFFEER